jgi:hypothetical protein
VALLENVGIHNRYVPHCVLCLDYRLRVDKQIQDLWPGDILDASFFSSVLGPRDRVGPRALLLFQTIKKGPRPFIEARIEARDDTHVANNIHKHFCYLMVGSDIR